MLMLNKSGKKD